MKKKSNLLAKKKWRMNEKYRSTNKKQIERKGSKEKSSYIYGKNENEKRVKGKRKWRRREVEKKVNKKE